MFYSLTYSEKKFCINYNELIIFENQENNKIETYKFIDCKENEIENPIYHFKEINTHEDFFISENELIELVKLNYIYNL